MDGRDELILLRDDNNSSANIYCHLVVYDWNHNTNEWTEIQNLSYGTEWADVAAGDFVNDDRAELVLVRQQSPTTEGLMLVMNAQTGQTITDATFGYFFHAIATGDVNNDGRDEVAAVRDVIATSGAPRCRSLQGQWRGAGLQYPRLALGRLGVQVCGRRRHGFGWRR